MAPKSQSRMLARLQSQKNKIGKSKPQNIMKAQKFQCKYLLASKKLTAIIVILTILLVCGAAGISILCYFEEAYVKDLLEGVDNLRGYLISQNASHANKTDAEIVLEALRMSDNLIYLQQRNVYLANQIDLVSEVIKGEWTLVLGNFYFLNRLQKSFHIAKWDCESRRGMLAIPNTKEIEKYIEDQTKEAKSGGVWIGLYFNEGWEWVNGERLSGSTFWAQGEPKIQKDGFCVEIRQSCNTDHACWYTAACSYQTLWMCEVKLDPELLT